MKTVEWAQVLSAAFAAGAAGASWASVVQSRKALEAGTAPDLHVQALRVAGRRDGKGEHMEYLIHNAGAGIAKGVMFLFVGRDAYVAGVVGHGLMRGGQTVRVATTLHPPEGGRFLGIVSCRDVKERSFAWDGGGKRARFRSGPPWKRRPNTVRHMFERMYRGVSVEDLPHAQWTSKWEPLERGPLADK